ncbi:MAG: phosphoribosylanthranilate isomerase [Hyphomicrobiaceae bacterium]|nr:phosphoribosylanthranilate isomerase [Hyphomicrobiaceae bacterium]
MTKVKICGVRTRETLDCAIEHGADYIGLVLFPKSPRHLEIEDAAGMAAHARGRTLTVVLLVDPDDALIDQVCAVVKPDLLQLHGRETPERVAAIRARAGRPLMKALGVSSRQDVADAEAYLRDGLADLILFDAKPHPRAEDALPGGNGLSFDWHILDGVRGKLPFALAGGLNPDNVAAAIRLTGADIVDVSSGVERVPGEKSPELIARFLAAAKTATPHDDTPEI